MTESDLRRDAARMQLKLDALTWMDTVAPTARHRMDCCSQDPTGHAAPCTCGAEQRNRVPGFIRTLILEAK